MGRLIELMLVSYFLTIERTGIIFNEWQSRKVGQLVILWASSTGAVRTAAMVMFEDRIKDGTRIPYTKEKGTSQ